MDNNHLRRLRLAIGTGASIGVRHAMEDRSCAVTFQSRPPEDDPVAFVAIYDGHAGQHCASFLQTTLIDQIRRSLHTTTFGFSTLPEPMLAPLLTQACALADDSFLRSHLADDSGSCAAFALIGTDKFAVGNIGDSQLVLSRDGEAINLCVLHAPNDPNEKRRIEAANGRVLNNGRYIFGYLGVSRAFGDRMLKEDLRRPIVISQPDVVVRDRSPGDEFLLIACDGLFEVFTPATAVDFVRSRLETMAPAQICDALVAEAIAAGSQDNVSVVLAVFQ
ncbi:protein phosphatase 2C [Achlya hypogyna]|uniref:Protein phosphatase 2C n=2 Tax=Achlya hypogyna TaxID=1202772 RepID=A0A1V9YJW9_ACHHY|nr:protein phosphatase 2C [Achlya hypogyna]